MVMGMAGGIPWSRLLRHIKRLQPRFTALNRASLHSFTSPPPPTTSLLTSNAFFFDRSRMRMISPFCSATGLDDDGEQDEGEGRGRKDDKRDYDSDFPDVNQLLAELRREEMRGGAESDEDNDYMGMGVIKDVEVEVKGGQGARRGAAYSSGEEGSDEDDDLDPADAKQAKELDDKRWVQHIKRATEYNHLLKSLRSSRTFDEAYKWMDQIDCFQAEHFEPSNEYKVLGWLLNRLNEATGKERFILQMKTQRALKHLRLQAEFDPQNPDNWGVMKSGNENTAAAEEAEEDKEDKEHKEEGKEDQEEDKENEEEDKENEGDQIEEKDKEDEYISDEDIEEALSEQVQSIDKEIKRKLAEMELTFGKQSRDLEEEIKELVGQRQSLTVQKDVPIYRKGFDVKLIDVNRTCKVTKAGQVQKYSAIVAVGNFNGIVGYGKAKGSAVASAIQKAHVKSFENLHYIDRYKEHTIAHAIQAKFKKTKIYLWPGAINTGMRANRTVESILYLAGLRNVKSKVIGSRNVGNTVKALFKALNMIETPQDIQEKFGRSVVESYLLK